jgi:hypothetical protein
MVEVENEQISGKDKKKLVIKLLKEHITLNNEIEDLIISLIDYLILVDKRTIKIRKFNIKKMFNCCIC